MVYCQVISTACHAALCLIAMQGSIICAACAVRTLHAVLVAQAQSLALYQAEHKQGAGLSSLPRVQEVHAGLTMILAVMFAANIPPYAVGGALLIVGALMVANVAKIPWDRIGQVQ